VLTDAAVVDLLRRHFVPVAINWKSGAGGSEDERRLRTEWGLARTSPTGTFVIRKDGTLVARGGGSSPESLAAFLRQALARLDPVRAREETPRPSASDRGIGVRPDGSIRLALTARAFKDGRAGNHRPMIDSVVLAPVQVRTLAPPAGASAGARYAIPVETAREFARLLTDDGDRVYAMRPQDATEARLEATVVPPGGDIVVVRLEGAVAGRRPYSGGGLRVIESAGRLEGILTFGPGGDLVSLVVVSEADYRNPWARAPHAVGGLLEWKR
jgi:hypothetical protein